MSRTCAYSLWLCHNATEKSTSYEILSSTGTSAPSGGQRVSGKGMVSGPQARSACTHPGVRMHAGPSAFTCIRQHILVHNGQTQGRTRSGVLTPSPTSACLLLSHHSRARPPTPTCVCRCPHGYAALELTMTHAADASWHVACQYAGAASSACCVGKCTGACDQEDPQRGTRLFVLVNMGVVT